jgi:hypothetical protein
MTFFCQRSIKLSLIYLFSIYHHGHLIKFLISESNKNSDQKIVSEKTIYTDSQGNTMKYNATVLAILVGLGSLSIVGASYAQNNTLTNATSNNMTETASEFDDNNTQIIVNDTNIGNPNNTVLDSTGVNEKESN